MLCKGSINRILPAELNAWCGCLETVMQDYTRNRAIGV